LLSLLTKMKKGLQCKPFRYMAPRAGLEPATNGLTVLLSV